MLPSHYWIVTHHLSHFAIILKMHLLIKDILSPISSHTLHLIKSLSRHFPLAAFQSLKVASSAGTCLILTAKFLYWSKSCKEADCIGLLIAYQVGQCRLFGFFVEFHFPSSKDNPGRGPVFPLKKIKKIYTLAR